MSKTYKQLLEASGTIVKDVVMPSDIRYLNVFSQKMSAAMQHNLEQVHKDINQELNKFGYSIGSEFDYEEFDDQSDEADDIDVENDENSGEANYFIVNNSTKNPVRNLILSLAWDTRNITSFPYKQDGSKLKVEVDVEFIEIDMADMETILGDEDPNKLNPRDGILPESKEYKKTKTECKGGKNEDCGCDHKDKDTQEEGDRFDDKCRAGTKQLGTKIVDGRQVPNCVKVNEDAVNEGKMTGQNKDDLIKTLAQVLYKGDERKAKEVFDKISFGDYLELSTALVDDDVAKAKKIISKNMNESVSTFSEFVQNSDGSK